MWELKQAQQKSNNSAAGPDEVHYNLLTPLPESVLSVLLKVYNYFNCIKNHILFNKPSLIL